MKKILLLIALACLPLLLSAQTSEKKYYIYNIITFSGSMENRGLRVNIDNGKTIEKLKDSKGKKMRFNTPAAALMYLYSLGWELFVNGATTEGFMYGGIGASEATAYWIIRKPCTKEEFYETVKDCMAKEEEEPFY